MSEKGMVGNPRRRIAANAVHPLGFKILDGDIPVRVSASSSVKPTAGLGHASTKPVLTLYKKILCERGDDTTELGRREANQL